MRPSWLKTSLTLITCSALWLPALAPAAAADKPAPAGQAAVQVKPPKLVVVMVIDGLPAEQVQRYRDQFGPGGLRRLLEQGASFTDAHQAHGITVTAIGHSAVLTGAYPYRHGIIGNNWIAADGKQVYCTEDTRYHYIDEETDPHDGTSPANLRVDTLGDQLRYATGNRSKVVTVSGKDRGAILLAGKTGTAYMFMDKTGDFASSTYYMDKHPAWVERFRAAKPQDRYYAKSWKPLLDDKAYADDAPYPAATTSSPNRFPFTFYSMGPDRCESAAVAGHCPLTPVAITTAGVRLTLPAQAADFYVAATLAYSSGGDTDACVVRFKADGSVSSFGTQGDGARCINFDNGGNDADRAVALARTSTYAISGAVSDTIHLAASVARATLPGIGVARLDGSGNLDSGFGAGGTIVFGGCGDPGSSGDCNFVNVENTPLAMTCGPPMPLPPPPPEYSGTGVGVTSGALMPDEPWVSAPFDPSCDGCWSWPWGCCSCGLSWSCC